MVRPDGNVVPHTVEPTIGLAAKKVTGEHPGAETPVGDSKSSEEASVESEENTAKSLLPDPNSLEHLLTHLPKHPGCYSCQLAKMKKTHAKRCKDHGGPRPEKFGDQCTADTLVSKNKQSRGECPDATLARKCQQ